MPWQVDPTPGARAARRRTFTSRPHQSDYGQMQLMELAETIRTNPFIAHKFGPEIQISVGLADDGESLMFRVGRAP